MQLDAKLLKRTLMAAIFLVSLGGLATIIYQFLA